MTVIEKFLKEIRASQIAWDDGVFEASADVPRSNTDSYVATGKTIEEAIKNFYEIYPAMYIKDLYDD